jgi:hypothetical protein
MSAGLHPYPVGVTIEIESGSAIATACAWIDGGKAWKKRVTTTNYEGDYKSTGTEDRKGDILTSLEEECPLPEETIEYDPPLDEGDPGEALTAWLLAAGELQSIEVEYQDEVTAASIRSAAEGAMTWAGDNATTEELFTTLEDWAGALTAASYDIENVTTEEPGTCTVNTKRIKVTRSAGYMPHIPMQLSYTGGAPVNLTGGSATTGWLTPAANDGIFITLGIGPYA